MTTFPDSWSTISYVSTNIEYMLKFVVSKIFYFLKEIKGIFTQIFSENYLRPSKMVWEKTENYSYKKYIIISNHDFSNAKQTNNDWPLGTCLELDFFNFILCCYEEWDLFISSNEL